jgi:hypothetical protein
MYYFNRRTAEPLKPPIASGYNKPTSRCQTSTSIKSLSKYQPVIPGVPFIRWSIIFPFIFIGSLRPTSSLRYLSVLQSTKFFTVKFLNQIFIFSHLCSAHLCYLLKGDRPSQTAKYEFIYLKKYNKIVSHILFID